MIDIEKAADYRKENQGLIETIEELEKRVAYVEQINEAQYKLLRTLSNNIVDLIKTVKRLEINLP